MAEHFGISHASALYWAKGVLFLMPDVPQKERRFIACKIKLKVNCDTAYA
ncbi:MAG: hypothetical protein ACP5GS_05420 [Nitrososphaeria archaeon]